MQLSQLTTLVVHEEPVSCGAVTLLMATDTTKPSLSSIGTPAQSTKLLVVRGLRSGQLSKVRMGLIHVRGGVLDMMASTTQ
jgi:hypothetical protein